MTTPDFPDWQQPVGIVDQAVQLGDVVFPVANLNPSATFDVSGMNSLAVNIELPTAAIGTRFQFDVNWFEAGVGVDTQAMTFHSWQSYQNAGISELFWRLPVRGSQVQFSMYSSSTASAQINAYGSTRTLTDGQQTITYDGDTRCILNYAAGAIAAGASSGTFYIPPVARRMNFHMTQQTAKIWVVLTAVAKNGASGLTTVPFRYPMPNNVSMLDDQFDVPLMALEGSITNSDTATHTCTLYAWDIS